MYHGHRAAFSKIINIIKSLWYIYMYIIILMYSAVYNFHKQ